MNWITRKRPKIDRIACPWLIRNFIDKDARFYFVNSEEVLRQSIILNAIPYDVPGVEFTHYGDQCTFDYFVKKYQIDDPAIRKIATIVRAADTDRHELASQSPGLWAISAGMCYLIEDDHSLVEQGMKVYDALYAWAKFLQDERHSENPTDHVLLDVYRKFLKEKKATKVPVWAKELKELIQDQIDTSLSLTLKELSQSLQLHPTYLSREFSKYFDGMSFGDYIRKLRIEKAKELLRQTRNPLAEIAYQTGFSDQSHFSRIFKQHVGLTPLAFRKSLKVEKKIK